MRGEKKTEPRKAGIFEKYWIMIKIVAATFWASMSSLRIAYFSRHKRMRADNRLIWWAKRLTAAVKLRSKVLANRLPRFEPGKPYILMSNHVSNFDIPVIFEALPNLTIRMLTKKELFKIPLWGKAMELAEFISIDRKNQRQALRDLDRAKSVMEKGVRLWISPEGTRSRTGNLLPFKRGGFKIAIEMGAAILPIGLRGTEKVLPAGKFDFELGQTAEVHIGSPIDASLYNDATVKALMDRVEGQIRELAGLADAPIYST